MWCHYVSFNSDNGWIVWGRRDRLDHRHSFFIKQDVFMKNDYSWQPLLYTVSPKHITTRWLYCVRVSNVTAYSQNGKAKQLARLWTQQMQYEFILWALGQFQNVWINWNQWLPIEDVTRFYYRLKPEDPCLMYCGLYVQIDKGGSASKNPFHSNGHLHRYYTFREAPAKISNDIVLNNYDDIHPYLLLITRTLLYEAVSVVLKWE